MDYAPRNVCTNSNALVYLKGINDTALVIMGNAAKIECTQTALNTSIPVGFLNDYP